MSMAALGDRAPGTATDAAQGFPGTARPDATAANAVPPDAAQQPTTVGELISEITQDVTGLVRDEINLAKAELKQEATKAGKAGGMLAGAGYAGHLLVLFLSLTIMFALAHAIDIAWSALIVGALWGVAGAVLYVTGRSRLKDVRVTPEQTVETLKEDAKWARHPMS